MMNKNRLTAYFIIISIILLITSVSLNAQWFPYMEFNFYGNSYGYWNQSNTGASDNGFFTPYGNYPSPTTYLSPNLLSLRLESHNNFSSTDIFSPYSSFMSSGSFLGPVFSSFNSSCVASPVYPEPVTVGQNGSVLYTGSIGYNPFYSMTSSSAFIPSTPSPYTMNLAWYFPWVSQPSFLPPFILSGFGYGDNHMQIDDTKENPLPHSMKGYELYSWKVENNWYFTLITGTNRLKSYAEITSDEDIVEDGWVKITVGDIDSVKTILGKLPKSEEVSWIDDRWLEQVHGETGGFIFPDIDIVNEIKLHCMQLGIELHVREETGDFILPDIGK